MTLRVYAVIVALVFSLGLIYAVNETSPSEVTLNIFTIIYSDYDGATTNFDSLSESEVRNASGVVLERTAFGRVDFLEPLNLYDMKDDSWIVDFDRHMNITSNVVNVNDGNLPGINVSAQIALSGITFTTPVIYNKGVVCTTCTEISYTGGVYTFNTTVFEGPYFLREADTGPVCGDGICESSEDSDSCPADCSSGGGDSGGGGGGGGGGGSGDSGAGEGAGGGQTGETIDSNYDFTITPTLIEAGVRKGSYFRKTVEVENIGTAPITIVIVVDKLQDYVFPELRSFTLDVGEKREIDFDIYVHNGVPADAYLGKIKFISRYVTHDADFVLLVKNQDALFDISTTVVKKYVNPGGRARANISIVNMGDLRNFDVNLNYKILDFERNEYTEKEDQFAINITHNNMYFLDTPRDLPVGNYIFYATVRYNDVNATSFDTFTVERVSFFAWIVLILIILILTYITINWYKTRRRELMEEIRLASLQNQYVEEVRPAVPVETEVPLLP